MNIKFWGTRGSLPTPLSSSQIRAKLLEALGAARGQTLPADHAGLEAWLDKHLPFHTRGALGGNTPCVEIKTGSAADVVLLDGGTGIRDFSQDRRYRHTRGSRPGIPDHATFHIILSHLHWDHLQGIPFFHPMYTPGQRIIFYGGHEKMEHAVRAQFSVPFFPVPYEALKSDIHYQIISPNKPFDVAGLKVHAISQNHPGDSFGYRFEQNDKVFVYSTDCEHKQTAALASNYPFIEFYNGADLLVFDAMYSLDEATYDKADWGHSSNVMGVELAARSRVKRLALFHHDPIHGDAKIEDILFSTRMYAEMFHQEKGRHINSDAAFPTEILLAYDGLEIAL